jgi:hypothetical protein
MGEPEPDISVNLYPRASQQGARISINNILPDTYYTREFDEQGISEEDHTDRI